MKKMKIIFSFLLLTLLFGCSSYQVHDDYDSDYNFSRLKTYAYEKKGSETTNVAEDSLIGRRIKSAIDKEMKKKGFERSSNLSTVDFLVGIEYRNREYLRSASGASVGVGGRVGGGMGIGVGYGFPSSYYGKKDVIALRFLLGNIQKTEVWKGIVSGDIEKDDPHETTKSINEAVGKLLEDFPPDS